MDVDFIPTSSNMVVGATSGFRLSLELKLKPEAHSFAFPDRTNLDAILFSLSVSPISEDPREENDGRLGDMSRATISLMNPGAAPSLIILRAWIPDNQFNVLYTEISKGNPPWLVSIGISDEPEHAGLTDGVWTTNDSLAVWNADFYFNFSSPAGG